MRRYLSVLQRVGAGICAREEGYSRCKRSLINSSISVMFSPLDLPSIAFSHIVCFMLSSYMPLLPPSILLCLSSPALVSSLVLSCFSIDEFQYQRPRAAAIQLYSWSWQSHSR